MKLVLRILAEYVPLWRIWAPLLALTVLIPPLVLLIPVIEQRLVDDVILPQRLDLLPLTAVSWIVAWSVSAALGLVRTWVRSYLSERMLMQLRERMFAQCESLSVGFVRREHSGRTLALINNDAAALSDFFGTTIVTTLGVLVGMVLTLTLMVSLSWQLGLFAGILPLVLAGLGAMVARPLRPATRRVQEKVAELNERLHESLSGLREIVAFGYERQQGLKIGQTLSELLRLRMRVTLIDTGLNAGQNVLWFIMTLSVAIFGSYLVITGQTTLGTLVAMRSLFTMVFQPSSHLASMAGAVQRALASADRVYAFLDEAPAVREVANIRLKGPCHGEVTFEGVSFAYAADRPVLEGISFTAHAGQVTALVGPSGAGKSTLVGLIARFYDPTSGRILLDGVNVRDLPLADLRAQIGMVFQDTFLFASTIRENVAIGRVDATEAEIIEALRAANAWEFVDQLPKRLDTEVGERGVQLSEGQRQRIAIARALLRNPRILILDEPTSALDARAEHLLQSALDHLMRGRTTFVIAHRLATVRRADQILVIDDRRVVECGRHEDLIRRQGLYRELFELQFGRSEALEPLAR